MTKLDTRQQGRLNDLRRAWRAQSAGMKELLAQQAKEREELAETLYAEVVKATALALEVAVPKRQIGAAVGTVNYVANRKGLHEDALKVLSKMKPTITPETASAPTDSGQAVDLNNSVAAEQWAQNLRLEYVGQYAGNYPQFKVTDPAGLVDELFRDDDFPTYFGDAKIPGLEGALLDHSEIIIDKMEAAKND